MACSNTINPKTKTRNTNIRCDERNSFRLKLRNPIKNIPLKTAKKRKSDLNEMTSSLNIEKSNCFFSVLKYERRLSAFFLKIFV